MARLVAGPKGLALMIEPGDSPYAIAAEVTGDPRRWSELVAANPQKPRAQSGNFASLLPGERLTVPASWLPLLRQRTVEPEPGPDDAAGCPDAGALPEGWTDYDVQIAVELAGAYDADPEDIMAIWMSESGLQPTLGPIGPVGYYGLIMGADQFVSPTAGWPSGTWPRIVKEESLAVQLQAIAKFWDAQVRIWLKGDTAQARAEKLGVTPAAVIYALNFVPAYAARMTTADQPMVVRPSGGCTPELKQTDFYCANPGFDVTNKGYISMRDMDLRIAAFKDKARRDARTAPLLALAAAKVSEPFQGLAALFRPVDEAWSEVTGRSPYIGATWKPAGYRRGGGESGFADLGVLLGVVAVVAAAWYKWTR